jgi:hypothetical protein
MLGYHCVHVAAEAGGTWRTLEDLRSWRPLTVTHTKKYRPLDQRSLPVLHPDYGVPQSRRPASGVPVALCRIIARYAG